MDGNLRNSDRAAHCRYRQASCRSDQQQGTEELVPVECGHRPAQQDTADDVEERCCNSHVALPSWLRSHFFGSGWQIMQSAGSSLPGWSGSGLREWSAPVCRPAAYRFIFCLALFAAVMWPGRPSGGSQIPAGACPWRHQRGASRSLSAAVPAVP